MEDIIIRNYPSMKHEKPYDMARYTKGDFERHEEIAKSREDYEKWKGGINHTTKTKRKIKIGGNLHRQLGHDYFSINRGNSSVLFTELDGINVELYMQETNELKKAIEDYNLQVRDYNLRVSEAIRQINALESWEEFIEFEGLKYGIPHEYKGVHRENNCLGLITEDRDRYEGCTCHCCEDWGGCSNPTGRKYYQCNGCGYNYTKKVDLSKNYKGK